MLTESVSRNSVLTMYVRISSHDIPAMDSIACAWSATRSSHPSHVGSSVTPSCPTVLLRYRASIRWLSSDGGNNSRVKKYACGSASGINHASLALRAPSAELPWRSNELTSGALMRRNAPGTNRDASSRRASLGVSANVR